MYEEIICLVNKWSIVLATYEGPSQIFQNYKLLFRFQQVYCGWEIKTAYMCMLMMVLRAVGVLLAISV